MTATFSDLRSSEYKGPRTVCKRCGSNPVGGNVRIETRQKDVNAPSKPFKPVASKAMNMCEPCCVEVYTALLPMLLERP